MASAKKCDRCKQYYDNNERYKTSNGGCKSVLDGVAFTNKNGSVEDQYDLCDDCITIMKGWLSGEIEEGTTVNNEPTFVKYDATTTEWFRTRPDVQTTVMQCGECGLWYKPLLGHKCAKRNDAEKEYEI